MGDKPRCSLTTTKDRSTSVRRPSFRSISLLMSVTVAMLPLPVLGTTAQNAQSPGTNRIVSAFVIACCCFAGLAVLMLAASQPMALPDDALGGAPAPELSVVGGAAEGRGGEVAVMAAVAADAGGGGTKMLVEASTIFAAEIV